MGAWAVGGSVVGGSVVGARSCRASQHQRAAPPESNISPLPFALVPCVQAVAIHGDISQGQRTSAVEKFKSGEVPLLVATDVAARGLDIPDVEVGWGGWLGSAGPVVRPCMPFRKPLCRLPCMCACRLCLF